MEGKSKPLPLMSPVCLLWASAFAGFSYIFLNRDRLYFTYMCVYVFVYVCIYTDLLSEYDYNHRMHTSAYLFYSLKIFEK